VHEASARHGNEVCAFKLFSWTEYGVVPEQFIYLLPRCPAAEACATAVGASRDHEFRRIRTHSQQYTTRANSKCSKDACSENVITCLQGNSEELSAGHGCDGSAAGADEKRPVAVKVRVYHRGA
jgi:hypothetical protein